MLGSQTARGQESTRDLALPHVAFRSLDNVSTPDGSFAAQYPAYSHPYQRFTEPLTGNRA